jgi:hypothetical protein
MRENDDIYEFWNKLPGPGEFDRHKYSKIPDDAPLWEGVKAEERQCEGGIRLQSTEYRVRSTEGGKIAVQKCKAAGGLCEGGKVDDKNR